MNPLDKIENPSLSFSLLPLTVLKQFRLMILHYFGLTGLIFPQFSTASWLFQVISIISKLSKDEELIFSLGCFKWAGLWAIIALSSSF